MESTVLVKSMLLIEQLANEGEQTLGSIAASVGQTRPTAHRILSDLVGLGYVSKKSDGVYGLTTKLRRIALGGEDARLVGVAEKPLTRLRERTGETANLGVLRGTAVQYLSTLECEYPLRRVVVAGECDPFYSTALGRVLVSELPDERIASMLRAVRLVKRSSKTEVNRKALQSLIKAVADDGYAVEHDQTDIGISCVAAPVRKEGVIVAAVSISGVQARISQRPIAELIGHVQGAAASIGRELRKTGRC